MTLRPYQYTLQTIVSSRGGINILSNGGLLNWNSRGYRNRLSMYRTSREQKANPLLVGSRAILNMGLRNSGKLLCIKFENSGWSLSVYKDNGFWINGFRKPKKDIDMIFGYMASRHNLKISYDEAEDLFLNVINVDLEIAQTFVNKLNYTFYNDKNESIETLLNIQQTGREDVSIELNDGLWVSMKFKPFKSFMRACNKNKNKWSAISPEELYYTLTGKLLAKSQVKLVHAFLEQNRRTTLVEKRSMQLIEDLEERFTGRIKNITYKELQNKHTWEEEEPIWVEYPAMIIKGKQLDWMVYSRKHDAHRNGTQDVSTYMIVNKDNYVLNEETGYYESICSSLMPQSPTKSEVYFFGPICIDQSNTDVSLGDQYAARALALLNDVASMSMVSTLRSYQKYKPEHRIDFDAVSELSVY